MPVITSMTYPHLLKLARTAYEDKGPWVFGGRTSITQSAIAFEAFVNELEGLAGNAAESGDAKAQLLYEVLAEAEKEKVNVLFRVSLAHLVLAGALPVKGEQPYQDLKLLIRVRNALVHHKYDRLRSPEEARKLPSVLQAVVARGIIKEPDDFYRPGWELYLVQPEVAKWAHNTAIRSIRWLGMKAPESVRGAVGSLLEKMPEIE
jgi:hypothetical protein